MATITADSVGGSHNIIAGLDAVAFSEIGPALLKNSDNGYNVIVGSTASHPILFTDYAKHPDHLNNDIPVPSTAAGRYQILYRYWMVYQRQLKLPDFGKLSQDRVALQLFRETGAYEALRAGRFEDAMHACRSRWASLPGAGYGQHENSIERLIKAYTDAGGAIIT